MASINAAIRVLDRLCGLESNVEDSPNHPTITGGRHQLEAFTEDTLGGPVAPGLIRIMVTMPPEAEVLRFKPVRDSLGKTVIPEVPVIWATQVLESLAKNGSIPR
jgi:hypothetical protein